MSANNTYKNDRYFDLFDYFDGKTQAWGIVESRTGQVLREFYVDIMGQVKGDDLQLDEQFLYHDGIQDQRLWRITRLTQTDYEGVADDVIGRATGHVRDNVLHWSYCLQLPYKKKKVIVKLDDRMYLQDHGVLINRAKIYKFGIKWSEVTIFFKKC